MADDFVQLPFTATTSGNLLDASLITVGANAVKRERMVIVDDTKTANFAALVTTSGALSVQVQSPATIVSASSGLIQISGSPTVVSASSGLIQISGSPTIVSASSGLIQISGSPTIVSASSGLVQVYVTGTSGAWATVTSSGGLGVTILGGAAGSTDVNIVGSTGTQWIVTSAGVAMASVNSSGGIYAPVTSSEGLLTKHAGHVASMVYSTIGAPTFSSSGNYFTTLPAILYTLVAGTTGAAAHHLKVYYTTGATLNAVSTFLAFGLPAAAGNTVISFSPGGVLATGGLYVQVNVNGTSTAATTVAYSIAAEYAV